MDLPCPDEKEDTHDEKDEALRGEDGVDDHELGAAACDQRARAAKTKQSNELVKIKIQALRVHIELYKLKQIFL